MKKVGVPAVKKMNAMFKGHKHGKLDQMQFGESQESLLHLEGEGNNHENDRKFNQMPSGDDPEAHLHLEFILNYMEIIDKALVDEIPKVLILMLGHKLLDFLIGGYGKSLLRSVQKEIKNVKNIEEVMVRAYEHEERIKDLKKRKMDAEKTLNVLNHTQEELNRIK